jgi:hypothetical protein
LVPVPSKGKERIAAIPYLGVVVRPHRVHPQGHSLVGLVLQSRDAREVQACIDTAKAIRGY